MTTEPNTSVTVADDLARTVREALDYLDDAYTWDAVKALDALVAQAVAAVPEGSSVADDLATLRPLEHQPLCASFYDANRHDPEAACNCSVAAHKRVEAEIARLEQETTNYAGYGEIIEDLTRERDFLAESLRIREESQIPVVPRAAQARLEAAEAEVARLTEQLDTLYRLNQKQVDLVRAAEGREARLRDGLREIAEADFGAMGRPGAKSMARALLAEDGAA